jgi:hypothetical protein
MQREYYIRDRKVVVEEINEVKAIHDMSSTCSDKKNRNMSIYGNELKNNELPRNAELITSKIQKAFKKSNWSIVKEPESYTEISRKFQKCTPGFGKFIKQGDCLIGLLTNQLNVQLDPKLSRGQCIDMLNEFQMTIISEYKLSKNLFEVSTDSFYDAIEASVELHMNEDFILAEPSFLEYLSTNN